MELKDRFIAALKDHEKTKPRNQQIKLGPSELGGCREYIRNIMVGTPQQDNDEWATAAVVGTLVGAHVETVAEQRLGAATEVPVTTELPNGLRISGHADIVLVEENACVDIKTKNLLTDVVREGASLENLIQISVYTLGLVQKGILKEGATAHLIYIDRSGQQQNLHEVVLGWDEILAYIEICVGRLDEVVEVQELIDGGEIQYAAGLRDKTPPFCYSPRVMCPFRDACWKSQSSDWYPSDAPIEDEETVRNVQLYAKARDEAKEIVALKDEYRERLIGVSGLTPDGFSVNWAGNPTRPALYVTKVREKETK